MWAVRAAKVFCVASARGLAILFLAASRTFLVGPSVGGVGGGHTDGCDAPWLLAGGVEVGQGLGVVEPGVVQDDRDLLSLIGLARRTTYHEGGSARRSGLPGSGRSSSSWSSGSVPRRTTGSPSRGPRTVLSSFLWGATCVLSRPRARRGPRRRCRPPSLLSGGLRPGAGSRSSAW